MSTNVRAKLSNRGKYYIPKHRYYELKHFCLQYPEWKTELQRGRYLRGSSLITVGDKSLIEFRDPVHDIAAGLEWLQRRIEIVESVADAVDPLLSPYILEAVTKGASYEYLRTVGEMPLGRNAFYSRYRRFFYLLDFELRSNAL